MALFTDLRTKFGILPKPQIDPELEKRLQERGMTSTIQELKRPVETGIFSDLRTKFNIPSKPMAFQIGAGLPTEQAKMAETIVRKPVIEPQLSLIQKPFEEDVLALAKQQAFGIPLRGKIVQPDVKKFAEDQISEQAMGLFPVAGIEKKVEKTIAGKELESIIKETKERGLITSVKEKVEALKNSVAGEYIPRDTDELAQKAKSIIKLNIDEAHKIVNTKTDEEAVAVASELINHYSQLGEKAKTQAERNVFFEKAANIANEFAPKLTELGRAVQAASIMGRLTPEGIIRTASKEINKFNLTATKKIPALTGEQAQEFFNEAKRIKEMPDGLEKAMAFQKLTDKLGELVPSKNWQKFIAVWKAGLLTGIKTSGLNIAANLFHGTSEIIKDVPAAAVDSVFSLFTKQRTLAPTLRGTAEGVKEGFEKGFRYLKTGFDERNIATKLDYRKVNFGKGPIAKGLQKYEETIFKIMGATDQPFYYGAKARSLQSQAIAEAKNKGLKGQAAKNFVDNFVKNPSAKALTYATLDAEMAVFQNKTALGLVARTFQKIPVAGELVVPFGRTPSAVAMQLVNYSPVGPAKEIISQIAKGKFDQRLMAQALGRGVTGLGLMSVGGALLGAGKLTLGRPKSERERNQWDLEGKKPNSILIDNKWRNVNVFGPLGLTMIVGGYWKEALEKTGSPIGALSATFAGAAKSLTEQTFLKGLSGLMDAINQPEIFGETFARSQLGSIIPTIISDLARATDEEERESNRILDGIYARTPGLRQLLEPKINVFGEKVIRGGNILETMADPFRPSRGISNDLIQELRRLSDAGSPATPTTFAGRGDFKTLTPEQNTKLKQRAGQLLEPKLNSLIKLKQYKDLPNNEKIKKIQNLTEASRTFARVEILMELTAGLSNEEIRTKLGQLKADGFLTKDIYEKFIQLRY